MKTVDFGAPKEFGRHHFYVEIPNNIKEPVSIYEDCGFDGSEMYREVIICRVILPRKTWNKLRDNVRRDFNERLKKEKESRGKWATGKVKLDRFLGRELCVLGWAIENANIDECDNIIKAWLALRPEERWWLYNKIASEAGLHNSDNKGWRKAVYYVLVS